MTSGRKKLIFGNWKMNCLVADQANFISELEKNRSNFANPSVKVAVFPPFTLLNLLSIQLKQFPVVELGAQDLFYENKGAYTGEISPVQLKDIGCEYVLVGHSERRHLIGEKDDLLSKKVSAAIDAGLKVVFCIGEKLEQRDRNLQLETVSRQLSALTGIKNLTAENLVVAYEPVWAIGTGRNATGAQAQEMHKYIREVMKVRSSQFAEELHILYGGSVKSANIEEIISKPDVDGALIGGASIVWNEFFDIISKVNKLVG
ncbi:MAG: triose-phosphate isomerase [Planctomycetes bacterium]|nr:triose-phosphate isomerase [Planctomycetota bacterium]